MIILLFLGGWLLLFAGLGYTFLKKVRYPLNVYGIFFCNALMLIGLFWVFPLVRDGLGAWR